MTRVIGLDAFDEKRSLSISETDLISFEADIAELYQETKIKGPIHLSDGNESQLLEIFTRIDSDDWVFAAWRNHYHALLHGVPAQFLRDEIVQGRSMGIMYDHPKFFSSSIVGGIVPIALGVAMSCKRSGSNRRVWCFVGDMTYESGLFWEAYKYSRNFKLPLTFVVEDNDKSVTTDTVRSWGGKSELLNGVVRYKYSSKYPHHGTGKWVNF